MIDTSNLIPQKKLFHNVELDVYPTTLKLSQIQFWRDNNRTLFSFETLQRQENKKLDDLSLEEITRFIAGQKIHKLSDLAKSIKRNGVQVPLIIRDDGKLLDGNRRFFACQWLKLNDPSIERTDILNQIPVLIVRRSDLDHETELKILAEANFVPDLKVPWSLDAQARAVDEYFQTCITEKNISQEQALLEVTDVFGIAKARISDLLDTLKLTKEFISAGDDLGTHNKRRAIVEERFVYFWEFRNKAIKGRSRYRDEAQLDEVKDLFFSLMSMGKSSPIKNVKQIEPLVQSRRDKSAWTILKESNGSEIALAISIVNEKKEVRKAEDKIRLFQNWFEERDFYELSESAKKYLLKLRKTIEEKAGMLNDET